ncbi:TetR/AcrR family transcriptional regulator [Paludibacterium yongneupense]|uniref:TetR/AcrR family transcriptional regulator n=1 Tax=Paludibacterium yongneupense TaxID=400061 RepID=UPI0003FA5C3E|nr:TetR/AcrR family transcriptional regulator [Paludibacterium yongneupense]
MRYKDEQRALTRQRIVEMAAHRYQAEGIGAVGIANLMADLGMTHGGFYRHFSDKEALVAETCRLSFRAVGQHWRHILANAQDKPQRVLVEDFLAHRPDFTSFASTLAAEISRRDHISRRAFTAGVQGWLEQLQEIGEKEEAYVKPGALLALMLGCQLLTRVVSDPALAQRITDEVTALVGPKSMERGPQDDSGEAAPASP